MPIATPMRKPTRSITSPNVWASNAFEKLMAVKMPTKVGRIQNIWILMLRSRNCSCKIRMVTSKITTHKIRDTIGCIGFSVSLKRCMPLRCFALLLKMFPTITLGRRCFRSMDMLRFDEGKCFRSVDNLLSLLYITFDVVTRHVTTSNVICCLEVHGMSIPNLGRFSDPSMLILASLAEGPKHGYAMMEDIETFAGVHLGP